MASALKNSLKVPINYYSSVSGQASTVRTLQPGDVGPIETGGQCWVYLTNGAPHFLLVNNHKYKITEMDVKFDESSL